MPGTPPPPPGLTYIFISPKCDLQKSILGGGVPFFDFYGGSGGSAPNTKKSSESINSRFD